MKKKSTRLVWGLIGSFYLISHLVRLTLLPVFADEAIYIRWSQLIMDDWQQYLFFPLDDGKTPLMMWLMVPFQYIFSDQLFAGRFVSVLIGLGQIFSLGYFVKLLGGDKKTTWLVMLLGVVLPFWYFHHRMALTEALLCLGMTWVIIGVIQIVKSRQKFRWTVVTAISIGLSMWAKLPAVLIIPSLWLYPLWLTKKSADRTKHLVLVTVAILGGLAIFLSLKLHPAFPQLFSRGGDFLYPWREVVLDGKWRQTLINIPTYLNYFKIYLTLPVLLLSLVGQFLPNQKIRQAQHALLISTLLFAGPIILLGQVVYPRYFLPISVFLSVSAGLAAQQVVQFKNQLKNKQLQQVLNLGLVTLLIWIGLNSARFMYFSLTQPNLIPLVSADQEQYLYKWSSGHGIKDSVAFIQKLAQNQSVAVATEGYFGTLPDGILMYLHRQDVENLYVEGIGQPVQKISDKFKARTQDFDQMLLVVNSHRLKMKIPSKNLLQEYCRPDGAPCLQVWDVTEIVQTEKLL